MAENGNFSIRGKTAAEWREWLDNSGSARVNAVAEMLLDRLLLYEQYAAAHDEWEGRLLANDDHWRVGGHSLELPIFTQELFDAMVDVQTLRAKARGG